MHSLASRSLVCALALVCAARLACPATAAGARTIDARMYHLGTEGFPEWEELAGRKPHGRELTLQFDAAPNAGAATLLLTQKGVKQGWAVLLNGKRIGALERQEQALQLALEIPANTLRAGGNELRLPAPKAVDDIEVGEFQLLDQPPAAALTQAQVEVAVTETGTTNGLPSRITITDSKGVLVALHVPGATGTNITHAARPGTVYTRDGRARIGLRPGTYVLHASRGFEYSMARHTVTLAAGATEPVGLQISREVLTPNLVAADTHIHTVTYSKHGDASMDERMLTIAGEGIELAVATDHNLQVDFAGPARALGVASHFTPVIGNEVTTRAGHFNAFPIAAGAPVPDFKLTNWPALMQAMRATPGVQVIQLNHPRNVHSDFSPFSTNNFNRISGRSPGGLDFTFDAMEVVTSAAMQSDILLLFTDWFALLNDGRRITALGSSDTHDVARFILGQARTYVSVNDDNVAALDVAAACANLKAGRALVSFGLLTDLKVNRQFGVGDLARHGNRPVQAHVRVMGPSWVTADQVTLYANGVKIAETAIAPRAGWVKADVHWTVGPFPNDVHLVAIATGPGVTLPFWETPRPYQPASKKFTPRILGATNPVWLDCDQDGRFTCAREYAERAFARSGNSPVRLVNELAPYDYTVALHGARLLHAAGWSMDDLAIAKAFNRAPRTVQLGFISYRSSLK